MPPEVSADSKFEIGHVLFLDIVGYSKLLIEEQKERLGQLTQIVLGTAQVRDSTDEQLVRLPTGEGRIQTPVLLEAAEKNGFDALFGGGRRDEEKARAKERVFSFRDEFGQWDPKNQRPEIWNLYTRPL